MSGPSMATSIREARVRQSRESGKLLRVEAWVVGVGWYRLESEVE